ncbi:MAG: 50S ribosomal protein L25 [Parcubacteria group bacterium]|jgi:large subunit ribosomal protein L25|nr:50S ribosomal protein L25 [Parcubacteria group bacterium]
MTINIKAEKRTKIKKLDSLRKEGLMPAIFYGHKKEATPIQIKKADFIKAWRNAGESTVIKLTTPEEEIEALIRDVDLDPLTNEPRHADFYVFQKGHKVEIDVPLEFIGVSPAVKDLGGSLIKILHEVKIKAEPSNLPHQIEVDISSITELEGQILAKDIVLPKGVELIENEEVVVATVATPRAEKVEEEAPADLSSIEVEKKGKTEEVAESEPQE